MVIGCNWLYLVTRLFVVGYIGWFHGLYLVTCFVNWLYGLHFGIVEKTLTAEIQLPNQFYQAQSIWLNHFKLHKFSFAPWTSARADWLFYACTACGCAPKQCTATSKPLARAAELCDAVPKGACLQNFDKFQKFQLDNLVDFEKCCKTRIFLQKSVPIQPKTSNILPKICQKLATTLRVYAVV